MPCRASLRLALGGGADARAGGRLSAGGAAARRRNPSEFAGILALDKWTCNINGRQAVFQKRRRERRYQATFIDQGYCFHAGDWKFIDASLGGVFAENTGYRGVTGWPSLNPG